MIRFGRTLAVGVALVVVPGATASTATDVSALASEAADLVATEQALLEAGDVDAVRGVDARGHELLLALEADGVELTEAVRAALGALPAGAAPGSIAPPPVVYEAAAHDLARIASTDEAARRNDDGTARELVLAGLVALGLLALAGVLGRRPATADPGSDDGWDDGVTGVADRRQLDRDLVAIDDIPTTVAVMVVAIDRLEAVRASHGRDAGDELLRRVCGVVADNVRRHDVVYRSGDGEFCVLLPGAATADVERVAARIVEVVATSDVADATRASVSIGAAVDHGTGVAETLLGAGRALGTAQLAGGGCFVADLGAPDPQTV